MSLAPNDTKHFRFHNLNGMAKEMCTGEIGGNMTVNRQQLEMLCGADNSSHVKV